METLYFYSMGSPSDGACGILSIANGTITTVSGVASYFVPSYRASNPVSDQEVYNHFAGDWTDGNTFTAPVFMKPEQLREFLGF